MSTIISGRLFLGPYETSVDQEFINEHAIARVVNLTPTDNPFPALYFDIDDSEDVDILSLLDEAIDFIDIDTRPVLVHCMAGMSRSASVVMAYLMKSHLHTLHEALYRVYECRNCVWPNYGFAKQLIDYEERLLAAGYELGSTGNESCVRRFTMEDWVVFQSRVMISQDLGGPLIDESVALDYVRRHEPRLSSDPTSQEREDFVVGVVDDYGTEN